jgi:hypothetical protein
MAVIASENEMQDQDHPNRRLALRNMGVALVGAALVVKGGSAWAQNSQGDTLPVGAIQSAMHVSGRYEQGVLTFDLDRSDLKPISILGVELEPDMGFDTEISFQAIQGGAIVKYEMCLLDKEVTPVLDALFAASLEPKKATLTALHNHFLMPKPEVKFLHGAAIGDPVSIAGALYQALKKSAQPFDPPQPPGQTGLPNQQIANILHGTPRVSGKVLSVDVERTDQISDLGVTLKSAMQVENVFLFQSIGQGKAAADAEFIMIPSEVDAVARTLRANSFTVMAEHNHELFENPKVYYLHAFKTGDPLDLARGLRKALDQTNSQ